MSTIGGKDRALRPLSFDSGIVVIGDVNTIGTANLSVVIGAYASALSITADAQRSVAMGFNAQVMADAQGAATDTIAIGANAVVSGSPIEYSPHDATGSIAIGLNAHIRGAKFGVTIGAESSVDPTDDYSVAIGYAARTNGDGTVSAIAIGNSSLVLSNSPNSIAIGHLAKIASDVCPDCIAIGSGAKVANNPTYPGSNLGTRTCIAIGKGAEIGINADRCTVIGRDAFIGACQRDTIVIGSDTLVGTPDYVGAFGAGNIVIGVGASIPDDGVSQAIVIGSTALASGNYSVAIGDHATAAANQVVFGGATLTDTAKAFHGFTVHGFNTSTAAAYAYLAAKDAPTAEQTGLNISFNKGGVISAPVVKAAVTPPEGAYLLYIEP
jgi:hypothetical protein